MFALILTICVMSGNTDKCDDYQLETFDTIGQCLDALDNRTKLEPLPSDRYRSCGFTQP